MAHRIALWKRFVPKYPIYWKGNPQLRVFLPQFWMKLIHPKRKVPSNHVHFIVHPQMSKIDIKNYLEKIYKVPVLSVATQIIQGKEVKHPEKNYTAFREDDHKLAFVVLDKDETFEFPDIFEGKAPYSETELKDYKKMSNEQKREQQKNWDKIMIPSWFR